MAAWLFTCAFLWTAIAQRTAWAADYPNVRDQALRAFSLAYDEALASSLDDFHPLVLVDLATFLTVVDEDKARKALDLAGQAIATKPEDIYPDGAVEGDGEGSELPYSRETLHYIELAEMAALVDPDLARTYLHKACEWNKHRSETDEGLAVIVDTGLLALEGRKQEALAKAVAGCSETPTMALDGKPLALRKAMAHVLVFLDPDLALEFAGRFDAQLRAEALIKTGHRLAMHSARRGAERYAAALVESAGVEETTCQQVEVKWCVEAVARTDYKLLAGILDKIAPGRTRNHVLAGYVRTLATHDLEAARRFARAERAKHDTAGLERMILKAILERDPDFPFSPAESRLAAPNSLPMHAKPQDVAAAAVIIALGGDLDTALRRLLWVDDPLERADALASIASVIADADADRALSLLGMAFQLDLMYDDGGTRITSVAKQIMRLDPEQGRQCFETALDNALHQALQARKQYIFEHVDRWKFYSGLVQRYAEVDPYAARKALDKVRNLRFGYPEVDAPLIDLDVVDPIVAAYIALADPDMAFEAIRDIASPRQRGNNATRAIASLVKERPAEAERFVEFIEDEEQRLYHQGQVTTWKAYHSALDGACDVTELEQLLEGASEKWLEQHYGVFTALATAARNDRAQTVKLIEALTDHEKTDICLEHLARGKALEEVEFFVRHIEEPSSRSWAWLYTGRGRARQVTEWELLFERGLGR